MLWPVRGEAAKGPLLQVDSETVQLGSLDTAGGQRFFPASFTLSNAGDALLAFTQPRTSCGCTKASLAKMELSPGESTQLSVTVDVTGRYGQQRFSIYVASNAPDSPRRLSVEATVPDTRTGLALMPPLLTFREAKPLRVNVRLFDDMDKIEIRAVDLPEGCRLLTPLPALIPSGGLLGLDVDCSPETLARGGRQPFVLHSNHPQMPRLEGTLAMRPRPAARASRAQATKETANKIAPVATATPVTASTPAASAPVQVLPIRASVLRDLLGSMPELSDVQILDVRSEEDFAAGRVPRSRSYPPSRWGEQPFWSPNAILVIVADDDEQAAKASQALPRSACRNILTLQGGFPAWKKYYPAP